MGLYYRYVNVDRQECIDGDSFLGGVKYGSMSSGLMPHLLVHVLTEGGRVASEEANPRRHAGRWAGHRIVVAHDGRDGAYQDMELADITFTLVEEVWRDDDWRRGLVLDHIRTHRHMISAYSGTEAAVWAQRVFEEYTNEHTRLLDEITNLGNEDKEDGT